MRQFLISIQSSLESQNWLAALTMTLTLPDMAGWAQYPKLAAGERYRRWFNENLRRYYTHNEVEFLSASDCWALRCSFLHSGQDDVSDERARRDLARFCFSVTGSHLNRFHDVLQLDVRDFCGEFLRAAQEWLAQIEADELTAVRLNSMLYVRTEGFDIGPGIRVDG